MPMQNTSQYKDFGSFSVTLEETCPPGVDGIQLANPLYWLSSCVLLQILSWFFSRPRKLACKYCLREISLPSGFLVGVDEWGELIGHLREGGEGSPASSLLGHHRLAASLS